MMNKVEAYSRYRASQTEGTKQSVDFPDQLHDTFVYAVGTYERIDPDDVNMQGLEHLSYDQQELYRTLMSTMFHVIWGPFDPKPRGAGNTLLLDISRVGDAFNLREMGFFNPIDVKTLTSPKVTVTSSSVIFQSGLTTVTFETSDYKTQQGRTVWRFKIVRDGFDVRELLYLTPCAL